jgi:hypothetical protein
MSEGKKKINYYQDVFSLFLKKEVPERILKKYLNEETDDHVSELSDFIGMNMKNPISEWSTCIGVLDAVDTIYNEAIINGNIKRDDK